MTSDDDVTDLTVDDPTRSQRIAYEGAHDGITREPFVGHSPLDFTPGTRPTDRPARPRGPVAAKPSGVGQAKVCVLRVWPSPVTVCVHRPFGTMTRPLLRPFGKKP